jgi:hypothetical protein
MSARVGVTRFRCNGNFEPRDSNTDAPRGNNTDARYWELQAMLNDMARRVDTVERNVILARSAAARATARAEAAESCCTVM